MIIHSAPQYQIYFGDAKDQMFPDEYQNWNNSNILSRLPIQPIAQRLHLGALFFLHQVHGANGMVISPTNIDAVRPLKYDGDFLITQELNVGIGVLTADCLPVIIYDRKKHVIGIAHAGWRGAALGVVIEMINRMKQEYAVSPSDFTIFFGPSAKQCCYQVDSQFEVHFETYPYAQKALLANGNALFFDLPFFIELQLLREGVAQDAIRKEYNSCTICDTRFHSHRRGVRHGDPTIVGRQMTVVTIK